MARPKKAGLDYYYKTVDEMEDFRKMLLMDRYGPIGYAVVEIVEGRIYKNGYYLETPLEYLAAQVMRLIGTKWIDSIDKIIEIIHYCGETGIFDRELLEQSVITSQEIQRNYSYVSARRKADKSKYWLLPQEDTTQESIDTAETGVYAAQTGVYAAETGIHKAETGIHTAETGVYAAQTGVYAAETGVYAAENRIIETETGKNAAEHGINAAIIPQSRGNKSRADETKENEMRAEQSKAEPCANDMQRKMDCDAFYDNEMPYAAAKAAAAGYSGIDNAYFAAAGRHLGKTDKADIEKLRMEGADDSLIISALDKVASRRPKKQINSFRYFMPMIRDMLYMQDNADDWCDDSTGGTPYKDDGIIHSNTDFYDAYADCTTTEDYLAAMEREFSFKPLWG